MLGFAACEIGGLAARGCPAWWSSVLLHDKNSDCSWIREQGAGWLQPGCRLPLNMVLVKRKVRDSKLRNAVPVCLIYFTPYILFWLHERIFSSGLWACETFCCANKPSHFAQARWGPWGCKELGIYTWMDGQEPNHVSNSSMELFIIAVLANNFFQFGTNYLALFLFIILTSNLSIYDKVSCECDRIAADNTKSQTKFKSWQTMFVLCLQRKINS